MTKFESRGMVWQRVERARWYGWALALLAASSGPGATGCAGRGAAPRDAGGMDLQVVDAPEVRGADAEASVPRDAALVVDDAGWAWPPWLPPTARVAFATDPARMVPALRWMPCRDGRPGCRELERESQRGDPHPFASSGRRPAFDGVDTWLGFSRQLPDVANYQLDGVLALATLEGPTALAWRYRVAPRQGAEGLPLLLRAGRSFLTGVWYGTSPTDLHNRLALVRSDEAHALVTASPFAALDRGTDLGGANAQGIAASERAVGITDVGVAVYVAAPEGPRARVLREPTDAFARSYPVVVGANFFWHADRRVGGRVRSEIWTVRGAETPRRLVVDERGEVIGFDADGEVMAWYVGFDHVAGSGTFARAELWTAPFTADPSALRPRRLLTFGPASFGGYHAMGAGRYVVGAHAGPFWIADLEDGRAWRVESPLGQALVKPVFVNREEVGFEIEPAGGGCRNVIRLRLDALGPPQAAGP